MNGKKNGRRNGYAVERDFDDFLIFYEALGDDLGNECELIGRTGNSQPYWRVSSGTALVDGRPASLVWSVREDTNTTEEFKIRGEQEGQALSLDDCRNRGA